MIALLAAAWAIDLAVTDAPAGGVATLTVAGADPGERLWFVRSAAGPGAGPCPPALGGACLGVLQPTRIGSAVADAAGVATFAMAVPAGAVTGTSVHVQAAAPRAGVNSAVSPVVAVTVLAPPPDRDGDGFDARVDCDDRDPAVYPGAPEVCASTATCRADGRDDDCDGQVDEGCAVHDGFAVGDEVWAAGLDHVVPCDYMTFDRLRVEDGAVVRFGRGAALTIGAPGELVVEGTDATDPGASRVTFTSMASAPRPGDWIGVLAFGDAHVTGLDLRYAGGGSILTGPAAFGAEGALTLQRSVIADGDGIGVQLVGRGPDVVIDGLEVRNHTKAGVDILVWSDAAPIRGLVVSGVGGPPLRLAEGTSEALDDIDADLSGDAEPWVELAPRGHNQRRAATWPAVGVPVRVLDSQGDLGVLTVKGPLTFGPGFAFEGGIDASASSGTVDFAGTADAPVQLTDVTLAPGTALGAAAHVVLTGRSSLCPRRGAPSVTDLWAHDLTGAGPIVCLPEGGSATRVTVERVSLPVGADVVSAEGPAAVDGLVVRDVSRVGSGPVGAALRVEGDGFEVHDVTVAGEAGVGVVLAGAGAASFLAVDGAVGAGVHLLDAGVAAADVDVRGVRASAAGAVDPLPAEAGLVLSAAAGVERVVSAGNLRPAAAATLDAAAALPKLGSAYVGNTVDEVDVASGAAGVVTLDGLGVPYAVAGPIVLQAGASLSLDGASLRLGASPLRVDGGALVGDGCRIDAAAAGLGDGVFVTADPTSALALTDCAVTGFGGDGVSIDVDTASGLYPDVALLGCTVAANGGCGVRCVGGCDALEAASGAVIGGGGNHLGGNGSGETCE